MSCSPNVLSLLHLRYTSISNTCNLSVCPPRRGLNVVSVLQTGIFAYQAWDLLLRILVNYSHKDPVMMKLIIKTKVTYSTNLELFD